MIIYIYIYKPQVFSLFIIYDKFKKKFIRVIVGLLYDEIN